MAEVYEPVKRNPDREAVKKIFRSFFRRDEEDREGIYALNLFVWPSLWQKFIFTTRLEVIHKRILKSLEEKPAPKIVDAVANAVKTIELPHYDPVNGASFAEKDFLCGDDNKKKELSEILLSDIKPKYQKIQSIQFKTIFQRMYLSPKKLDYAGWWT